MMCKICGKYSQADDFDARAGRDRTSRSKHITLRGANLHIRQAGEVITNRSHKTHLTYIQLHCFHKKFLVRRE